MSSAASLPRRLRAERDCVELLGKGCCVVDLAGCERYAIVISSQGVAAIVGDVADDTLKVDADAADGATLPAFAIGTRSDGTQVWLLEAVDGDKVLEMSIYEAYGGPTSPANVEMTEAETSYSTCGTCLVLRTGCIAHNGHYDCRRAFMPRAEGTIFLDELGASPGGSISGEMVDLVFQEVLISDRGRTNVVTDGAVLNFDPWEFDLRLGSLGNGGGGGAQEECSGHGRLHGDHCDCDPGYRPDPQNAMACIPL